MSTYLDILPEEIIIEILSHLDYDELQNLKQSFPIIQSNRFWIFKLYRDFFNFKITDPIYPVHPDSSNYYYNPDMPKEYIDETYQLFGNDYEKIYYVRIFSRIGMKSKYKCLVCGSSNVVITLHTSRTSDALDRMLLHCYTCRTSYKIFV